MKEEIVGMSWLGPPPITHHSVIKENFSFLYGGGSQQSTSLSHSINHKEKLKVFFLIDSIQELVDWMGWIKNIL